MRRLLALLVLTPLVAYGVPTVISDGTDTVPGPTHCGWYFDAAPRVLVPVGLDSEGLPRCVFDVGAVTVGPHVVQATFVIDSGVWGIEEGPKSLPLAFTRPAAVGTVTLPAPVLRLTVESIPQPQ